MKTDDLIDLLAQDPLLKTPRLSSAELYWRLLLGVGTSVLVLLAWHGLTPGDVLAELQRREGVSGVAEKTSRK